MDVGEPKCRRDLSAIIDIGSNSIRLVIYDESGQAPRIVFNEKTLAALGRGVARSGRIDAVAMRLAIDILQRFRLLCTSMGVAHLWVIATAAVRDARNGSEFVARAQKQTGLTIEILDGVEEARLAALGVVSDMRDACGIVGDLGGGSLELARVADGQPRENCSLPLGVLRLAAYDERAIEKRVCGSKLLRRLAQEIEAVDLGPVCAGDTLFLVGGAWRALARFHMYLGRYPSPILHHYRMSPIAVGELIRALQNTPLPELRRILPRVTSARLTLLPLAAGILQVLVDRFRPQNLVISARGLREGILFERSSFAYAQADPLLMAARRAEEEQARIAGLGAALFTWLSRDLFSDMSAPDARLCQAACLLCDLSWCAHPDFRAAHGLGLVLHGNWPAISLRERALIGAAVFSCLGGKRNEDVADGLAHMVDAEALERARHWGLAMRLGVHLSGGVPSILADTRLKREGGHLSLDLPLTKAALANGASIKRRLRTLAKALKVTYGVRTPDADEADAAQVIG